VSRRVPAYVRNAAPLIRELVCALKGLDEPAAGSLLIPDSEADWGLRLFGLGPLLFLLYMHLECDDFVMPRIARRGSAELLAEVGWVTGVDDEGMAVYDPRRLSTVTLRRQESRWGIADVNPAPLDQPVTMSEAQGLLKQVIDKGEGQNPLWFAYGVLTGAFQLKRMGREPLDEVEELFVAGMQESSFGLPEIIRAVRLWREFKRLGTRSYHRPQVYAAAVEYIMVLFGFYGDAQSCLGERYGVSSSSISATWREIETALGLSQFDSRYSLHADPGAPLEAMLRQRGEEPPPPTPLGIGRGSRSHDTVLH
jgi:hypothetical protein